MVEVKVDPEKCDGCRTCVGICPVDVLETEEEKCHADNPPMNALFAEHAKCNVQTAPLKS